jgi:hypothetical protein
MKPANAFGDEDNLTKIETAEGATLFLISKLKSHQANLKTYFPFGEITIYEEGKRGPLLYKGELISMECLNPSMEWTQDYFKRLRACIIKQEKRDVTYSFKNEEEMSNLNKVFKITFKVAKGAEIMALTVRCGMITTNKPTDYLMEEMLSINTFKNKTIGDLNKKVETLDNEKVIVLDKLNEVAKEKQDLETELIDKFTLILNEKKKKFIELQSIIENTRNGQSQDITYDKNNYGMEIIGERRESTQDQLQPSTIFDSQWEHNMVPSQNSDRYRREKESKDGKGKPTLATQPSLTDLLTYK